VETLDWIEKMSKLKKRTKEIAQNTGLRKTDTKHMKEK
jgi:hypothetical protein